MILAYLFACALGDRQFGTPFDDVPTVDAVPCTPVIKRKRIEGEAPMSVAAQPK
jgi:hypothetical protein